MTNSPKTKKFKKGNGEYGSSLGTQNERQSLSLWCRRTQTPRSHSTVCFVHETRLGSHMLNVWLPNLWALRKQSLRKPQAELLLMEATGKSRQG